MGCMHKIAMAIETEVLEEVDRVAKKRRTTRSSFIRDAVREALKTEHEARIEEAINSVFSDSDVRAEQAKASRSLAAASRERRRAEKW